MITELESMNNGIFSKACHRMFRRCNLLRKEAMRKYLFACLLLMLGNVITLLVLQKSTKHHRWCAFIEEKMEAQLSQLSGSPKNGDISEVLHPRHVGLPVQEANLPGNQAQGFNDMDGMLSLLQKNMKPSFTLGRGRKHKAKVAVGIPSVRRKGVSYIHETLDSLSRQIYPNDEEETSIVVFLAEDDKEYVQKVSNSIYRSFAREVDSGLLQVIGPPIGFYPDFSSLRLNFGDSRERVMWRSKEVVDAGFLMNYCRNKGNYYLMMEDDVVAIKGYMTLASDFIEKHDKTNYTYLSLTNFGSIGKVWRTSELPRWITYFFNFFDEKPIDWLMTDFVRLVNCNPSMGRSECQHAMRMAMPQATAVIFRHIGKQSSLDGKIQHMTGKAFDESIIPSTKHRNPPAEVSSTFLDTLKAHEWYKDSGGMKVNLHVPHLTIGDVISFSFILPQNVTRILIRTGSIDREKEFRLCSYCASLEFYPVRPNAPKKIGLLEKVGFEVCAVSDANGDMACRPPVKVTAFRVKINQQIQRPVRFDLVYVKTVGFGGVV